MADTGRIIQGFQPGGVFLPLVVAVIIGPCPDRDHQVVVGNLPGVPQVDRLVFGADRGRLVENDGDVVLPAKNRPDRLGDFRGGEPGRGHLVEQGLEEVVVLPVNQGNEDILPPHAAAELKPPETAPENDNVRLFLRLRHASCYGFLQTSQMFAPNQDPLPILYQDDRYVAVHKPAGMLVHRSPLDRGEKMVCLQLLRDQLGCEVFPCHRLDRPTSGILLFALDREALKAANEAFAGGRVEKVYHAVVRGWIQEPGRLDYPLRPEPEDRSSAAGKTARAAVTAWRPLERYEVEEPVGPHPSARFTLLEMRPETGRRHQLRRHAAHLRHPIIGDTRHGDGVQNRFFRERFACQRMLLAAVSLCLHHPFAETLLRVEAAPERDFLEGVRKLVAAGRVSRGGWLARKPG